MRTCSNSGTIIVDATCAPSNIRYPQDVSLLNEARENAEKLLDILHSPTDGKKPRTYRKRARKDYLKYVRCRKHTAKMTRKAIGKQLNYLKRDLAAIDGKLNQEKALNIHQTERLETIRKIYEQQKYMYNNHTHSVENRIVSVNQPFVRPIVRGKVGKPVEFGMKLDISVTDGWTRLEYRSFDAYNEATKLQEMIENFHKREGHYPSRVLADKIYRNRENLGYCKARGIRLSGPALGRPKKGEDRNKAQDYRDECERVEVERKFSLGKRKCGMGLVTAKLEETAAHVVALSILLLNLRKIQCAFFCNFWIGHSDFCNRVKNGWLFSRHYIESNLVGFYNILEACRRHPVAHLVYASSSSVYGTNRKVPYAVEDKVDNPVSLYAATKKSDELMAHAYSKLYNIPSTGLRFFTVYGPAGRPDMAYFSFTNKLLKGETIQIFNYGNCQRDFTYVDDIVTGVRHVMCNAPEKQNGEDGLPVPPYRVYNIGNSHPENLLDFVDILQQELIRAGVLSEDYDFESHKELVPMQPGDVPVTYADTSALERDFGFKPNTGLREGLRKFAQWYKEFYF